jgi:hypothetical protein
MNNITGDNDVCLNCVSVVLEVVQNTQHKPNLSVIYDPVK